MNHHLLLRAVVYLQLLVTISIFCMVQIGPDNLSTIHPELTYAMIPGASFLFLIIFFFLFHDYQYSWKQFLFVSVSYLASLVVTGICLSMLRA